jgi:hypothetical protein
VVYRGRAERSGREFGGDHKCGRCGAGDWRRRAVHRPERTVSGPEESELVDPKEHGETWTTL